MPVINATFIILHKNSPFSMIALLTDKDSPRIRYVLNEIFGRRLGLTWEVYTEKESFKASPEKIKIKYLTVNDKALSGLFIQSHKLMFEKGLNEYFSPKSATMKLPEGCIRQLVHSEADYSELESPFLVLFPGDGPLGFDPLAMTFYYLSRYEEYLPFDGDEHGRYLYQNTLEHELKYDPQPFVDVALTRLYWELDIKNERRFEIEVTADIDILFRFHGRSILRSIGSVIRHPKFVVSRVISWLTGKDSFAPSQGLIPFFNSLDGVKKRIFLLVSEKNNHLNKQVNLRGPKAQKEIAKMHSAGLDPQFHASWTLRPQESWEHELNHSVWDGKKPIESRQHFIHLDFPQTYRTLISLGIKHDWSMGFAEHVGFRAGTSHPFMWFDLAANKETDLMIHPFCLMDVTAKNYMKLDPEQAIAVGASLKNSIRLFGGTFCFIIHNESLSESQGWNGWTSVFKSWAKRP
jgi:hypothetical protein